MATIVNFSSVPYNKPTFKLEKCTRPSCILGKQRGSSITNCLLRRHAESYNEICRQHRLSSVTKKTKTYCLSVDDVDDTSAGSDPIISPVILVTSLYEYVNAKKLKDVGDLFSEECSLEDCSFPFPIQGKKETKIFFQQLMSSMGQNVKFIIDRVCENRHELSVAVNWHLEWNNTLIPFTRGCSFYECAQEKGGLVIKKAVVVIESPIKPGGIVMALLKNVTAIFDEFPKAAEWFLQSPHVIVRILMKTYATIMAPVIKPLIAGYIRIWTLIARFSTLIIQLLLYISKKYFPKD